MATGRTHARSVSYEFQTGSRITIDLDEDEGDESDSTLKGDDWDENSARNQHNNIDPEDSAMYRELPTLACTGFTLRPGKTVELIDGDFARLTVILEHRISKETILRCLRYRRNIFLHGLLEKKLNEITLLLQHKAMDPRPIIRQSTESVKFEDIVKIRQMIRTNQLHPNLSYAAADRSIQSMGRDWNLSHGRLVCRWQLLDLGKNQGELTLLTQEVANHEHSVQPDALRQAFRGSTQKGGSCARWSRDEKRWNSAERQRCGYNDPLNFYASASASATTPSIIDLTLNDSDHAERRYTFGDGFCGAGGTSRGAKGAGLRNEWGFDFDTAAIESFSMNFAGANCWAIAAHDFILTVTDDMKVDILHISPPCQTFSPAHTRLGRDDEMNEATFLATRDLIKKVKPRIVTVEETFGLTRNKDHVLWFNAMVQMFSSLGFSVRWKVFDLREFGLPQPRKRLFLFASCAGEALPEFPEPTHCNAEDQHLYPNRKPYMTVNQAIAAIPPRTSLHDPNTVHRALEQPYDGNQPLRSTITCGMGHSYHPSGRRQFTLREIALLQGFPLEHEFGKTRTRKQIGNAVPPIVAKVFFEEIIKALRKVDGLS